MNKEIPFEYRYSSWYVINKGYDNVCFRAARDYEIILLGSPAPTIEEYIKIHPRLQKLIPIWRTTVGVSFFEKEKISYANPEKKLCIYAGGFADKREKKRAEQEKESK